MNKCVPEQCKIAAERAKLQNEQSNAKNTQHWTKEPGRLLRCTSKVTWCSWNGGQWCIEPFDVKAMHHQLEPIRAKQPIAGFLWICSDGNNWDIAARCQNMRTTVSMAMWLSLTCDSEKKRIATDFPWMWPSFNVGLNCLRSKKKIRKAFGLANAAPCKKPPCKKFPGTLQEANQQARKKQCFFFRTPLHDLSPMQWYKL